MKLSYPGKTGGFSLIEMLLVIALIAAVSVLATAALSGGFEGIRLRSAAKEIASNLRYTRAQAIATGAPQRFVIDPRAHTWTAANGRDGDIPEALGIIFTGAREVQPQSDIGAVVFFPDGASTGGRVQLLGGRASDPRRAAWNIDVAWLTGQVTLKRGQDDIDDRR